MTRSRAITAAWLLGAAALTLTFTAQLFRYGDEWWHIALGREILSHGIPAQEPFSFVATQHGWVEQQWLYEVVLARLVAAGGAASASLAMGVAGSLALLVAACAVPRATRVSGAWRAAALIVGALMAGPALGVRGEVISALGVAATLLVLRRWRDGSRRVVWLLPPMFLLWANLHSGFIAGLALLGFTLVVHARTPEPANSRAVAGLGLAAIVAGFVAVIGGLIPGAVVFAVLWGLIRPVPLPPASSRRDLVLATTAAGLLTLVNPAGPGLYAYVAETLGSPLLSQFVSEWLSPNFHDGFTRLIEVAAALLVLVWTLSGRVRTEDVLLAAAAFLATLQAIRNVSLFAVVAVPQLAEYGAAAWAARAPSRLRGLKLQLTPGVSLVIAAAVTFAAVESTVGRLSPTAVSDFERTRAPEAPADYLAAHHPGQRVFSTDIDGGYLAYRFPAGRVVFIYDEIGLFGSAPLNDYLDLAQLHADWRAILNRYGFHHALLPADAADTSALLELGWSVDCYDPASGRAVLSEGVSVPAASPPPEPTSAPACGGSQVR